MGTLLFTLPGVGAVVGEAASQAGGAFTGGSAGGAGYNPGGRCRRQTRIFGLVQSHSLEWLPPRWGRLSSLERRWCGGNVLSRGGNNLSVLESFMSERLNGTVSWKHLTGESRVRGCDRVI